MLYLSLIRSFTQQHSLSVSLVLDTTLDNLNYDWRGRCVTWTSRNSQSSLSGCLTEAMAHSTSLSSFIFKMERVELSY